MPRRARQEIISPNALYHVVSRGNNQRRIFRDPKDYRKFLKIIKQVKEERPFYLYSYNFLPNHYHLEIETLNIPISKIMHQINFLYVNYFHRRYKTSGHLFQDRFYSSLIDKENYFWECSRYIDLNAVRAGLVKNPQDYQWSSYLIYYQKNYKKKLKKIIDQERFLKFGENNLEKSRLSYLEFVEGELETKKDHDFRPEFVKNKWMV